jgi:16S rRNA (guanine527-N7)-methyltransferase
MFASFWQKYSNTLGWQPTTTQIDQFDLLYKLVIAENQRQNLTRITAISDFWEKHLWDSLFPVVPLFSAKPTNYQLIDLGSGAGFPGLPLAIACPDWSITLLDSRHKKIVFIQSAINRLSLSNAKTICTRAESHQGKYDLITIRAVGSVPLCWSYAKPLLAENGIAILYRGYLTEAEIALVQDNLGKVHSYQTPLSNSHRSYLYLQN